MDLTVSDKMNSLESATLKNVPRLGPKFPRKICQGHNLAESTKFKGGGVFKAQV